MERHHAHPNSIEGNKYSEVKNAKEKRSPESGGENQEDIQHYGYEF